ncbi:hypothetical protein [Metapseudomonas otitidis]|uniref:hypothetical protein n=1 Tax=Metapseudomonas otitidis TaxID=319939 RepID=UPI001AAFCD20|nr:hypothetical protein [Pseudomonas otitidis]MBO2927240.1 hypothetical protein [Pseudomonas otitidis]
MSSDENISSLIGDWSTNALTKYSNEMVLVTLKVLHGLVTRYFESSLPRYYSDYWLHELKRVLAIVSKGEELSVEDEEQLYCCVYLLITRFEFEGAETGLFSKRFIDFREKLSASKLTQLIQAEVVFVSNAFNNARTASEYEVIREYMKGVDKVEERCREVKEVEKRTEALSKQLDKQEIAFNFVGLYKGFHDLWLQKRKELCWQRAWLIGLGCCVVAPLAFKLIYTLTKISSETSSPASEVLSEPSITLLVTLGALELVLIYFFRIMLHSVNSTKAQLLQIDLRRTLCRFIQKYSQCSKDMKDGNPNALEKFETLIFSGLVMQDDKLPSTFDGLEPIQKIFAGRAGKAGGPG